MSAIATRRLPQEGRLWVRLINRQVLGDYMRFRNETNRSLADKCAPHAKRAIIGHLRSGERTTCSPETARAIERALNAPPGSLFVPEVATDYRASSGRAA